MAGAVQLSPLEALHFGSRGEGLACEALAIAAAASSLLCSTIGRSNRKDTRHLTIGTELVLVPAHTDQNAATLEFRQLTEGKLKR
jgi:hypothetical protein